MMKKLGSLQRQELILKLLCSQDAISMNDLLDELGVSEWTLRRDLTALEDRRLVVRHYGGASLAPMGHQQYSGVAENFQTSAGHNVPEKRRIGRRTAALLHDGQTVAISAGTTTTEVAHSLREGTKRASLVTNALNIALELANHPTLQVTCTGGEVNGDYYSLNGPVAERTLRAHYFDVSIIGVSGIAAQGFTVNSQLNASVLSTMLEQSQRSIIVADSSKFQRVRFAQLGPLNLADVLVTDGCPPDSLFAALEAAGVTVIIASE